MWREKEGKCVRESKRNMKKVSEGGRVKKV